MSIPQRKVAQAARQFLGLTNDAEDRYASVCRYLHLIFGEIAPDDLTDEETADMVRALAPAHLRVTGTTIRDGAATIPRLNQLCEVLGRVTPGDLSATEALVLLTILIPPHSRVISRVIAHRAADADDRPLQRLVIAGNEAAPG